MKVDFVMRMPAPSASFEVADESGEYRMLRRALGSVPGHALAAVTPHEVAFATGGLAGLEIVDVGAWQRKCRKWDTSGGSLGVV